MAAKVAYYPMTGEALRLADCEADMDARRRARQREASLAQRCTELEQRMNAQELLLAEETRLRVEFEKDHEWLVKTMNRLATEYAHLTGEDEPGPELDPDPDEVPFHF